MKGSRVLATVAAVALSCFGMASPAFAGTPATYAAQTGVAVPAVGQAGLGGWQLIGWYPTAGACVRAATAYSIATCTPEDGGWVLYVYVND
jgi:hypothetical protein